MKPTKKTISPADAKISQLTATVAELQDKLTRSLADYANLSKRIETQQEMFTLLATASILTKMVEVLDNFILAYQHLSDPGLKIALNRFQAVLKEEGLNEVDALGKKFDPQSMECVNTVPGPPDVVISIQKTGYFLNNTCLRPAQVVVGKPPSN